MSYRSDALIAYQFKSREGLIAFFTEQKLKGDKATATAIDEYTIVDYDSVLVAYAYFESIKWYDSFPSVQAHTHMYHNANDKGIATLFIRLGEDLNDDEYDENNNDDQSPDYMLHELFQINRNIEVFVNDMKVVDLSQL
jgi:hypothetical protein